MISFTITGQIMLGFLTRDDSYDRFIEAGEGTLEFDGEDIVWVRPDGVRLVSHTINGAIDFFLEKGLIRRIEEHRSEGC